MLVELNKPLFNARIKRIYDGWNNAKNDEDYSSIADVDALLLLAGDPAGEDEPMKKGTSMQIEGASGPIPVEIFAQAKAKEPANDALPSFLKAYTAHSKVGTLLKETHTGKLAAEWDKLVKEAANRPDLVDMSPAVSAFMAVKDGEELKIIQTAANLTSTLLKHHVAPRLESILDRESKISHAHLAAQIESKLGSGEGDDAKGPDTKIWSKDKRLNDVDWQAVEFCYSPIIISRSSKSGYDLRYTAESTEDNIAHKGVLLVAFGMRYKSYCANVGRTFIVDPTPDQEAQYNLLLGLQSELLSYIKDGVTAKDVYQHALSYVKEKKPDLEKNFVKNLGFGTGVEFRDSSYLLSAKNTRVLKENMTVNLGVGFSGLKVKGEDYALHLVDTIRVGSNGSSILTEGLKSTKDTLFFLTPESEDEKPQKSERKAPVQPRANGTPAKKTAGTKVLRTNRRAAADEVHQTAAAKLAEHQKELHEKLQAEGLAKFSEEGKGTSGKEGKGWKKFQSYKGEGALPPDVDKLRASCALPLSFRLN
ncbi:FACT complex subunit spt16 [Paramarasmius palmivorus]|uniref:FACT complex subunit n=1 Tax=Paramarasmius palmivorus TaxID=297713 RepID=A0AAW0CUY8_9AGAR